MSIDALYMKYFQKSKIFLYPILDIKKGSSVTPIQTYLGYEGKIQPEDAKLITHYFTREDFEYKNFEKNVLFKHNRLIDFEKLDDSNTLFIFDYSDLKDDWICLINGNYSKMNVTTKRKILNHFIDNHSNHVYIESYLFPEKYQEQYALLLDVDIELIKQAGELCDKPDLEKEILTTKVLNLEKTKILD
jgi:hypothetical protein